MLLKKFSQNKLDAVVRLLIKDKKIQIEEIVQIIKNWANLEDKNRNNTGSYWFSLENESNLLKKGYYQNLYKNP